MLTAFTDVIGFYFDTIVDFLLSEPVIYIWVLLALCGVTKLIASFRDF